MTKRRRFRHAPVPAGMGGPGSPTALTAEAAATILCDLRDHATELQRVGEENGVLIRQGIGQGREMMDALETFSSRNEKAADRVVEAIDRLVDALAARR